MSVNDVRRLENMDLVPDDLGGNTYFCNGNLLPLHMAGAYAKAKMNETGNAPDSDKNLVKEEEPNENQEVLELDKRRKRSGT